MLNKKKAKTWVKVVAWGLAIAFTLSMTAVLAIPSATRSSGVTSSPRPNPVVTSGKSNGNSAADAAGNFVGQGDLALKSAQPEQAVGFFVKAYELDRKNDSIKTKLADAYLAVGETAGTTDSAKAKNAYTKYLELLPSGPQAQKAKTALKSLD